MEVGIAELQGQGQAQVAEGRPVGIGPHGRCELAQVAEGRPGGLERIGLHLAGLQEGPEEPRLLRLLIQEEVVHQGPALGVEDAGLLPLLIVGRVVGHREQGLHGQADTAAQLLEAAPRHAPDEDLVGPDLGGAVEIRDAFVQPRGQGREVLVDDAVGVLVKEHKVGLVRLVIHVQAQDGVVALRAADEDPGGAGGILAREELREQPLHGRLVLHHHQDHGLGRIHPESGDDPIENAADALEAQEGLARLGLASVGVGREVRRAHFHPGLRAGGLEPRSPGQQQAEPEEAEPFQDRHGRPATARG